MEATTTFFFFLGEGFPFPNAGIELAITSSSSTLSFLCLAAGFVVVPDPDAFEVEGSKVTTFDIIKGVTERTMKENEQVDEPAAVVPLALVDFLRVAGTRLPSLSYFCLFLDPVTLPLPVFLFVYSRWSIRV